MTLLTYHADALVDDRPALLLVHGILSSRHHWLPNLAALRPQFRCIRLELPGHGLAPALPTPEDYQPARLIWGIEEIRQLMGLQSWALIGQSLGATLTMRYALDYPARTTAHIFTNSIRPFLTDTPAERLKDLQPRLDRLRKQGRQALQSEIFHPRFAKRFPADIRRILSEDADAVDIDALYHLISVTMSQIPVGQQHQANAVPTLLINGCWERAFQPIRDNLAVTMPHLTVNDISGGHSINIEAPAEFNSAVLNFLASFREVQPYIT